MSRITHFEAQPKNIHYWDYYILCHLNLYAAVALQRFEYWDGTKSDGNVHAEDLNDITLAVGKEATQDTSRFVYKAQDELQWELMGLMGETMIPTVVKFLTTDLKYLDQRANPLNAMDRKKQYLFQEQVVQDHVDYLGYIISYFKRCGYRLNAVFYAIEQLTAAKVYIDRLSVSLVVEKLNQMYEQMDVDEREIQESKKYKPVLPKFLRIQLEKDRRALVTVKEHHSTRFRNFTEWKAHFHGIESAKTRNALRENTGAIAITTISNNKQQLQTEKREVRERVNSSQGNMNSPSPQKSFEVVLPKDVTAVLDTFDEMMGEPMPRAKKDIEAASTLRRCTPTKEDMIAVKAFILEDNPEWYVEQGHGIDLATIANYWPKWKDTLKRPKRSARAAPEANTEEEKARVAAHNQAQLEKLKQRIAKKQKEGSAVS